MYLKERNNNLKEMNEFLSELKGVLTEIAKDDEYFEAVALIAKKTYDHLVKVGFTEEQALRIVALSMNKSEI